MKTLFFTLSTLVTSFTAHAYTCQVDLVNNRGRIVDSYHGQTDYRGSCRDALRDCNREARMRNGQGLRCELRTNNGPGPGPGPGPQSRYEVTAIVENDLLTLQGFNKGDIFNQCMNQVRYGAVDEITMVTNSSLVMRLTTASYWSNPQTICHKIVENVDTYAISRNMPFDVFGSIERRAFSFRAYSKADALAQCYNSYRSSGYSAVDDITVGVNNRSPRRYTTPSYWSNASKVCHIVMQGVETVIP